MSFDYLAKKYCEGNKTKACYCLSGDIPDELAIRKGTAYDDNNKYSYAVDCVTKNTDENLVLRLGKDAWEALKNCKENVYKQDESGKYIGVYEKCKQAEDKKFLNTVGEYKCINWEIKCSGGDVCDVNGIKPSCGPKPEDESDLPGWVLIGLIILGVVVLGGIIFVSGKIYVKHKKEITELIKEVQEHEDRALSAIYHSFGTDTRKWNDNIWRARSFVDSVSAFKTSIKTYTSIKNARDNVEKAKQNANNAVKIVEDEVGKSHRK